MLLLQKLWITQDIFTNRMYLSKSNSFIVTGYKFKNMKKQLLTACMSIALSSSGLAAYKLNTFSVQVLQAKEITGRVASENKNLPGASVKLVELELTTVTDAQGQFTFAKLPEGNYTLRVQYAGMKTQEVKVKAGSDVKIDLVSNTIAIEGVQILGERSNVKGSTSTRISRQAIEHLQATSIAEVLQLLPGQTIVNPSFDRNQRPSIRQVSGGTQGGTYDAQNANTASLGTAIVVNGAQLSNNANMQAANTAAAGVTSTFSNSTGAGMDLRQISADNVESVEVIRGIPSVAYGDLTSGVIDIKTKATAEPLQAKFRLNPTLRQAWVGKGFGLGENKGALYVDLDYSHAADKQIQTSESYQRFNTNMQYTNTFGANKNWYTNTTLAFGGYFDDSKIDPDLAINEVIKQAENYDFRFATNGRFQLDKKFARTINYVLSTQMGFQNGYDQRKNSGDVTAVSNATENGTNEVIYLPSTFMQKMWVKGKPVNIQAKVTDNFYLTSGDVRHAFLIGADYSYEKNYGRGRYFADDQPMKINGNIGYRPRTFSDIPALNQFSVYVEDKVDASIWGRNLRLVAGLRYDLIQPFRSDEKSIFSPRVNASYELLDGLRIRGGYGISGKLPTMVYLYPDNAYADIFSLNYYKQDPNEALALMSTRVFSTENDGLKIAKSRKSEIGVDYKRFELTYYAEKTDNAYDMTQYYNFANVPMYTVLSQVAGQKPVLSPDVKDSLHVVDYSMPTNNVSILNKGVEFDMDFGRVDAIRTSFNLNGAYTYTKREGNIPFVYGRRVANQPFNKLGVFEARGREYSRFVTALRAIHHIPEVRLIVSVTAQTIWVDKDKYLNYTERPYGYIDIKDGGAGQVQYMSEAEIAAIPETSGIFLNVDDIYLREECWKPLWLFNTKLTKEFGKNYGFSLYVNNITNNRPYVQSKRYPTQKEKRNIPIYFGTELSIKF